MEEVGTKRANPMFWIVPLLLICLLSTISILYFIHIILGFIAFTIPAVVFLAVVFLRKTTITQLPSPPQEVISHLENEMRRKMWRMERTPEGLKIWIRPIVAGKVIVRPANGGSEVLYSIDATTNGWFALVIFFLLGWLSVLVFPTVLYISYKSSLFLKKQIGPMLSLAAPMKKTEPDIGMLLVNTLADGHRLSVEAYEAQRSNYHDSILIALVIWLLGSTFLIILLGVEIAPSITIPASFLLASFLMIPIIFFAVFHQKPRMIEFKDWAERLWFAWQQEIRADGGEVPRDTIGILLDVWKELPKWIDARRRGGHYRNPAVWTVILVLVYTAFLPLSTGIRFDPYLPQELQWIVYLISALLLCLAAVIYLWWRRDQELERERLIANWKERMENIEKNLEQILG